MVARSASICVLWLAWLCLAAPPAWAKVLHHWVQLGPGAELIARVLTTSPTCPTLQIDGRPVAMALRAGPSEGFPEFVCEQRMPQTAKEISIDGQPLPTLKPDVRRIVVIGDTGCRVRRNKVQACSLPSGWPLRAIMGEVAGKSPDLVIHVGDYLYRFAPCPIPEKCLGSPYGDNFPAWSADWLDPAQKLFTAAPFIFVRGNHENCGRGDKGWFRYFGPRPLPPGCPALTPPWKASVAGLDLIVFDSSAGGAPESVPALLPEFRRMAADMFAGLSRETWFLTHRPLWVNMQAFGELIDGDDTQRAAFGAAMPELLSLVLSGHIHAFQAIDLAQGPVQAISGNGGTLLDPMPTSQARNLKVAGSLAPTVVNNGDFGFLMLSRLDQGGWQFEAVGVNGSVMRRCQLKGRTLSCDPR